MTWSLLFGIWLVQTSGGLQGKVLLTDASGKTLPADGLEGVVYVDDGLQPPEREYRIKIQGHQVDPAVILVPPGAKVQFENEGTLVHNLYAASRGQRIKSGRIDPGETEILAFPKPGMVEMRSKVSPKLRAYVLVQKASAASSLNAEAAFSLPAIQTEAAALKVWLKGFGEQRYDLDQAQRAGNKPLALHFQTRKRVRKITTPKPPPVPTAQVAEEPVKISPPKEKAPHQVAAAAKPAPQKQAVANRQAPPQKARQPAVSQSSKVSASQTQPQAQPKKPAAKPRAVPKKQLKTAKTNPDLQKTQPPARQLPPPISSTAPKKVLTPPVRKPAAAAPARGKGGIAGKITILKRRGNSLAKEKDPVLIFIDQFKAAAPSAMIQKEYEIMTRNKQFLPRVLAIPAGAKVVFPNSDPIIHNVFSVSGQNSFDAGRYARGEGVVQQFDHPGLVRIYCNVHHQMNAYIFVVDNPFFTMAANNTRFKLNGLPAGEYTLKAWHPHTGFAEKNITVPANGIVQADLNLRTTSNKLKPHLNKFGKPYKRKKARDYDGSN